MPLPINNVEIPEYPYSKSIEDRLAAIKELTKFVDSTSAELEQVVLQAIRFATDYQVSTKFWEVISTASLSTPKISNFVKAASLPLGNQNRYKPISDNSEHEQDLCSQMVLLDNRFRLANNTLQGGLVNAILDVINAPNTRSLMLLTGMLPLDHPYFHSVSIVSENYHTSGA